MKLCICRDVSDKDFKSHLTEKAEHISCSETALAQCCGSPTNCGMCLEMADEIVSAHNRRVSTIRQLGQQLPQTEKAFSE